MRKIEFGNTGLKVTRIGLGMAALGRPGYINLGHHSDLAGDYDPDAMRQRTFGVLDRAWESGIRYFDAARSYGRGEEFLADWLHERRISLADVTVGSKWGYTYTADWQVKTEKHEVKEHSLAVLERQIGESRGFLGSYLRLYQIHSATLNSGVLSNDEVLDRLAQLRDDGLVIGLSLSGLGQSETLRRAMEIESSGKPLFGAVQATWNLLERSAEPALIDAKKSGMGVIIKEALANGRLTAKNDADEFRGKRGLLERIANEQETTIDAVALAAVLAQPWVDVVLSGAATTEHVESNVRASTVAWNDDIDESLAALQEPADDYWSTRSNLPWN